MWQTPRTSASASATLSRALPWPSLSKRMSWAVVEPGFVVLGTQEEKRGTARDLGLQATGRRAGARRASCRPAPRCGPGPRIRRPRSEPARVPGDDAGAVDDADRRLRSDDLQLALHAVVRHGIIVEVEAQIRRLADADGQLLLAGKRDVPAAAGGAAAPRRSPRGPCGPGPRARCGPWPVPRTAEPLEGSHVAAEEVGHACVDEEAHIHAPRPAQHQHEGHQRVFWPADAQLAESAPSRPAPVHRAASTVADTPPPSAAAAAPR